jgi:predicted oxidoreductase (fatty acid repression mutant protein)
MNSTLIESLKQRRTQYALGKNVSLDKDALTQRIKEAIRHTPSSFNSQSSRAVILFNGQSEKFWSLAKDELSRIVPADAFAPTAAKLDSFAAGIGTVLFYEDQSVVKGLQEQFALYADNFPVWSEQASGMAQFAVWLALTEAGMGASLQHYNPVADEATRLEWNVPDSWKLRAQMPFGSHEGGFGEKAFMDDTQRFITAG